MNWIGATLRLPAPAPLRGDTRQVEDFWRELNFALMAEEGQIVYRLSFAATKVFSHSLLI